MIVKIKRLCDNAEIPTYAHKTDACADLTATSKKVDEYGNIVYGTGIAMDIPIGYIGVVAERSSVCKQDIILTNCIGIIDSGYRGEVMLKFKKISRGGNEYNVGDKIAQFTIIKKTDIDFIEVDELSESERGEGGFGSTGK